VSAPRIVWTGLEELRAALRALPRELQDRAVGSVRQAGYRAGGRIGQAYPASHARKRGGGGVRLRQGVRVTEEASSVGGAMAVVRSTAKHAHLWEFGTGDRANRYGPTGRMVPSKYGAPVFVAVVEEERARMHAEFVTLLRHTGVALEVVIS
jgi:hypothetical protein